MGTRSLITINDTGKELVTIFRHWDGYPSVAGRDILNALKGCTVVNGKIDDDPTKINGIGRLACVLITKLTKEEPRIVPTGTREIGEEYIYTVSVNATDNYNVGIGPLKLTVTNGPMTAFGGGGEDCTNVIYDGPLDDFDPDMEDAA